MYYLQKTQEVLLIDGYCLYGTCNFLELVLHVFRGKQAAHNKSSDEAVMLREYSPTSTFFILESAVPLEIVSPAPSKSLQYQLLVALFSACLKSL